MPVTSDPRFVWPVDPSPVVGPDGVLSAKPDTGHAGVLLCADFENLFDDTSFEGEIADNPYYTSGGGATYARSTDWSDKGEYSLKITPAGSTSSAFYMIRLQNGQPGTDRFDFTPGEQYTVSAVCYQPEESANVGMNNVGAINISYADTNNNLHYGIALSDTTGNVPGEHRQSVTFVVPDDADHMVIRLMNATADVPIYWDSVVFRRGSQPGGYDEPGGKTVQKVRFVRDGQPVRSGDPVYAPGGIAVAYDHEAPLGQGVSYQAVPVMADGSEGEPSDVITLEVDAPVKQTWLKSVNEPDLSIGSTEGSVANPIIVAPVDLTSAGRVETTSIQGSKFPAATWDTHEAAGGDMSVLVYTVADRDRVIALLDSGPVLVQPARNTGIGQFYCLAGDVQQSIKTYRQSVPVTELSFPVTTVGCPSTVDTPLMIPGLTYESVSAQYATYKELGQQVPSYLALLGVTWFDDPEYDPPILPPDSYPGGIDGGEPDSEYSSTFDGGEP